MTDQALGLEIGQDCQRFCDGVLVGSELTADTQIDDLQHIQAEMAQIVLHRAGEVPAGECRRPRLVRSAPGADLCDDHQAFGIGMDRLADDLIGNVGPVIVAGVDVVDPQPHGLAHHGKGSLTVRRRPEGHRSGELDGAIADAVQGKVGAGGRERTAKIG
jgi:hypothetical protein